MFRSSRSLLFNLLSNYLTWNHEFDDLYLRLSLLFCIAGLTFNAELLGIGRGKDALPTSALAPPSTFPPLVVKAKQPLKSDESDYLLALSKEFR